MFEDRRTATHAGSALLKEVFSISLGAASALMVEAWDSGYAIVGTYPSPVARALVQRARAAAERASVPLRIACHPVGAR